MGTINRIAASHGKSQLRAFLLSASLEYRVPPLFGPDWRSELAIRLLPTANEVYDGCCLELSNGEVSEVSADGFNILRPCADRPRSAGAFSARRLYGRHRRAADLLARRSGNPAWAHAAPGRVPDLVS